jgi:NAD(P)-dependent dehydrogenase (short-subunit alcohol dehydrogenase family)
MSDSQLPTSYASEPVLGGRVALVTGGGAGIGRAAALELAAAGASVVVVDVDEAGLAATIEAGRAIPGGRLSARRADVTRGDDLRGAVAHAQAVYGGLDIVFANAGIGLYTDFETMTEDAMDRVLAVNLRGVLLTAQAAIPAMRARGGGSIVLASSVQATHSLRGCVVYAATKAAVIAAARTLALEVGEFAIRVNTVSPGTIDTPMLARDLDGMNLSERADFLARVKSANVLGRIGAAEEVGRAVVFLSSAAASYITGTDLLVDGGFSAVKAF